MAVRAANRASVRALEVHQTRSSSVSSQDHPAREFYRRNANGSLATFAEIRQQQLILPTSLHAAA